MTDRFASSRYIGSRIYLHNPPGEGNALSMHKEVPHQERQRIEEESNKDPKVSLPVAVVAVIITVGLMAVSAEWVCTITPSLCVVLTGHIVGRFD